MQHKWFVWSCYWNRHINYKMPRKSYLSATFNGFFLCVLPLSFRKIRVSIISRKPAWRQTVAERNLIDGNLFSKFMIYSNISICRKPILDVLSDLDLFHPLACSLVHIKHTVEPNPSLAKSTWHFIWELLSEYCYDINWVECKAPFADFCLPCCCTIECWKTCLDDEWWTNYTWQKHGCVPQTFTLSERCWPDAITCIWAVSLKHRGSVCKSAETVIDCQRVTQVRLLLADMQYNGKNLEWWLYWRPTKLQSFRHV